MHNESIPFSPTLHAVAAVAGHGGQEAHGIDFTSPDYLALATHPGVHEAVRRARCTAGPHGARSIVPAAHARSAQALEEALGALVGLEHVALFPTGWTATLAAITALVREADHIVIDAQAHDWLRHGAAGATRRVLLHQHLDCDHVRELLDRIRAVDAVNGILVVTEGLFATEARSPDLPLLQHLCREYNASLLVDVTHDLGALGAGGGGVLASQRMTGQVDIVTGGLSVTFATEGGFVACADRSAWGRMQRRAGQRMRFDALSPLQVAVATASLEIAVSAEGEALRADLLRNVIGLRAALQSTGQHCLGAPAPIVPVWTGSEAAARVAAAWLAHEAVLVQPVEFPGVPAGAARLCLHVMARHAPAPLQRAAHLVASACARAGAGAAPRAFGQQRYRD